jgi:hypothetical protein
MLPILATSVLIFALAWWNPKFMQLPSASIAPGAVSPMLLALASLVLGLGVMYAVGVDVMSMHAWCPVAAGALAVLALGYWDPAWMSRLPGQSATAYALAFLLVGVGAKMLCGGSDMKEMFWEDY